MHLRMLERDLLGGDTDVNQCTGRRKILECARHRVPIPCRVNDHREHVAPCDSVHPFKFRRVPFVQNGILDPIIGSNKFTVTCAPDKRVNSKVARPIGPAPIISAWSFGPAPPRSFA